MSNYKEYELLPPTSNIDMNEEEEQEQDHLLPSHSQTPNSKRASSSSSSVFSAWSHLIFKWISTLKPFTLLVTGYFTGVISVVVPLLLVRYCWTSCPTDSLQQLSPAPGLYNPPPHPNADTDLRKSPPSFPADIGSTQTHLYPPPTRTNAIPSLFPTNVGFAGPTATGAEPALALSVGVGEYPVWGGVEGLVRPVLWGVDSRSGVFVHGGQGEGEGEGGVGEGNGEGGEEEKVDWIEDDIESDGKTKTKGKFDIFRHWGNLTPFHSVPPDSFGISSEVGPEVPGGCTLKGVHILHRHGARYPTDWSGFGAPTSLASKLHSTSTRLKAHGALSFLNTWTYKLGTDSLTPFGRQQLFDLGVSMRMKYGALLEGFTDRLPVFRTESQDRMLASSTNFALGFFGWPLDDKLLLSVTVEENGVNNTLAPYKTCPNDSKPAIGDRGIYYVKQWVGVYLPKARVRIQALLEGVRLTLEDVYAMQMMCAYETTALGYSKFCGLFTEEEWEGFEYALDLYFWYDSGFGSPVSRALGSGYVLELLSRLTGKTISHTTPLTANPSTFSVNLTLDANPTTFPLDQPIYVDATHEVVVVNILTALNLTSLFGADEAPPSWRRMRRGRRWVSSRVAPFAANVQFQQCPDLSRQTQTQTPTGSPTQIRVILNDGVVALTGVEGCPDQKDGLCPLETFVGAQKRLVEGSDWEWTCHGNWTVPEGDAWRTLTGDPPAKP